MAAVESVVDVIEDMVRRATKLNAHFCEITGGTVGKGVVRIRWIMVGIASLTAVGRGGNHLLTDSNQWSWRSKCAEVA